MSSIVAHARGFLMGLGTHALLARAFISPTQFSKPADLAECLRRVRYNLSHFRYHYGMIYVFVLVWTILSSPQLLIGLLVLAAAWMYCFVLTNHYDAMAVTTRAVAVMAVAVMPVAVAVKAVTVTPVDTAVMALALAIGCFELSVQVYVVLVLVPYSIFIVTLPGMFNSLVFAVILSTLIALPHASFHATPCKYFAKGYCKLGAQCRFVHDESAAQQDGGRRRGGGGGGKGQMGGYGGGGEGGSGGMGAGKGGPWLRILMQQQQQLALSGTKLYHQTDFATANIIIQTQRMKPGSGGLAGGGIYFATTPELTAHKAHKKGVILEATVALGRIHTLEAAGDPTMTLQKLNSLGYNSVCIARAVSSGHEYVVYDPKQVSAIQYAPSHAPVQAVWSV
jgi:uncharacterized membrane protein YgcG